MTPLEPHLTSIFKTRGPLDPVNDNALYAPRPELDRLLQAAQATTIDAYMAILGSRQTGKTTLLYQMRHRLRPRGLGIALIDLAIVHDQPEGQLYRFVASGIRSELEPNLPRSADRRDPPLPGNPIAFRHFLLDIARLVRTPRIVILFDEVEAVPEQYSDAFFGTLRNVFSSRRKEDEAAFEKYLIVFSGSKELHRLTNGPNSPLNIAERLYLQDLGLDGVRLIAANFQRAGIAAPSETAQWLYEQTNGHPYLTQKLCQVIEQWHPENVDRDMVRRATAQVLRDDDHLGRMIIQIDADPTPRELLKEIVSGQPISFSRLNPGIARLELLGAVRDAGHCAVRNRLYLDALRAHFGIQDTPRRLAPRRIPWGRVLLVLLALVILVVNVPFLYVYTSDILLSPRTINVPITLSDLGAKAIVRYDPILRANSPQQTDVRVEATFTTSATPISVVFLKDESPDLSIAGAAQRDLRPPTSEERYAVMLNQSGWGAIPYNPFDTETKHRKAELVFEPQGRHSPSQSVPLDFKVDFYSGFVISIIVTTVSIIASVAGIVGNLAKILEVVERFTKSKRE